MEKNKNPSNIYGFRHFPIGGNCLRSEIAAVGWQVKIGASTALGKQSSSIYGVRIYLKSKVSWKMKKRLMCGT